MSTEHAIVKQSELFSELDDEVIDRFLRGASERWFLAGETLVPAMEENEEIYLLLEGRAVGRFQLTDPEHQQAFAEWGPGDFAGVAAFVMKIPQAGAITAETDVKALVWHASFWRDEAERDPVVGYRLALGTARILVEKTVEWSLNLLDEVSWGLG